MKNEQKKVKVGGITLVALVITIIILLIISGVTINIILGDNGLFNIAKTASGKYGQAEAREKLEIVLVDLQADKLTKPEYNEKEYIDKRLNDNGMEVDDDIVIVEEWQFEIDRSVPKIAEELGKLTKEDRLKPIITKIETTVAGREVNISVNAKDVDTVKYILRKEEQPAIIEQSAEITALNYKFSDLDTSSTYVITVEAKNNYGKTDKKATIKILSLSDLTQGKATFEITPNTRWQASVTATIEVQTNNESGLLQYRKGENGEWTPYSEGFEVTKNETLYGRYYDSVAEEVGDTFSIDVDVIDDIPPILTITNETKKSKTITVTVNARDEQIGMPQTIEYKYYIGTDGENYTLKDTKNTNSYTYTSLNPSTDYYVKITAKDKAGVEGSVGKKITTTTPMLVSKITLNKEEVTIGLNSTNKTIQLTATVAPNDVDDDTVIWTSSNVSVATVSNTGLVTAKSVGTVTINCASTDGGASEECEVKVVDGYTISNRTELEGIKNNLSATYTLVEDIDLSGKNWTKIPGFFTGVLDGNGHTISNLTIEQGKSSYCGFFNGTTEATIKNLKFKNPSVTSADEPVGIVTGREQQSTFSNIAIEGGKVKGWYLVGSIFGMTIADGTLVENCYSTASVESTAKHHEGGLLYSGDNTTVRCCFFGGTFVSKSYSGALVVNARNLVTGFYYNSEISGPSSFGTGLSSTQISDSSKYTGWDFKNTWIIKDGKPELRIFLTEEEIKALEK